MAWEMKASLTTHQIAEAGRLLVQYRLALEGMESVRAAPGSGHHLETSGRRALEVYSNLGPKPAGGKGRPALDPALTRSKHERILDTDFAEFLLPGRVNELLSS